VGPIPIHPDALRAILQPAAAPLRAVLFPLAGNSARRVALELRTEAELALVRGRLDDPGEVASHAAGWFARHLASPRPAARP
jgi:hypothetical protein